MSRLSKAALMGASDLIEKDVPLPALDGSVLVRSLPAAYSNEAHSEALVQKTVDGVQFTTVDVNKMEVLQIRHGLVDPAIDSIEEAEKLSQQLGPSFKEIVKVIDEISGVNKEAIEKTEARFPSSGDNEDSGDAPDADAGGGS